MRFIRYNLFPILTQSHTYSSLSRGTYRGYFSIIGVDIVIIGIIYYVIVKKLLDNERVLVVSTIVNGSYAAVGGEHVGQRDAFTGRKGV